MTPPSHEELSNQPAFEDLLNELNQVLSRIERGELGIDDLSRAVEEAHEKVSHLKSRLFQTEAKLEEVLSLRDPKPDSV